MGSYPFAQPRSGKAKGVEFTMEPRTIRAGLRSCFLRGPQGVSVELLERDEKYV